MIRQSFHVGFDYPVVFTRQLFHPKNPALLRAMGRLHEERRHRAVVFLDSNVHRHHPSLADDIARYFRVHAKRLELAASPRVIPGGERIKNDLPFMMRLLRSTARLQLCRHSFVIAIGGGAVLDSVGFVTSLLHRGLRLIRVPTTVLAQNDAGVGVKNGLNFLGTKNLIGTFAPPFAVLNDADFLATLSDASWRDGIAEAFKVAIIRDAAFFRFLCRHAGLFRSRDLPTMEKLVRRCAELHLRHIRTSGDPFELGRARPLDFGHWSAHKLERMTRHGVSHGQAVGMGIALDSAYAMTRGWLKRGEFEAIAGGLQRAGLSLWHAALEKRKADGTLAILDGLRDFQEHLGGELCVTFPRGIGKAFEAHEVDARIVERAIRELKRTSTVHRMRNRSGER